MGFLRCTPRNMRFLEEHSKSEVSAPDGVAAVRVDNRKITADYATKVVLSLARGPRHGDWSTSHNSPLQEMFTVKERCIGGGAGDSQSWLSCWRSMIVHRLRQAATTASVSRLGRHFEVLARGSIGGSRQCRGTFCKGLHSISIAVSLNRHIRGSLCRIQQRRTEHEVKQQLGEKLTRACDTDSLYRFCSVRWSTSTDENEHTGRPE